MVETAGRTGNSEDVSVVENSGRTSNSDYGSLGDETGCGSFSSPGGDSAVGYFGADDTGLESFACDRTVCDDVSLEEDTALESFAHDHSNPLLGFLNRNPYC